MNKQRLQKIISEAGICSRRKAELLIKQRRLTINGKVATIGEKADSNIDNILLDGNPIVNKEEKKVILINKPSGYICTCNDPEGRRTILSLLPFQLRQGLYPIGRLDFNSRGAILLTNSGTLALKLTHPRYSHTKTYNVLIKGNPSKESLSIWREGLILDYKKTMKTQIKVLDVNRTETLLEIIMREGQKRQIRRIANILGHPVIDLKRIAIGEIKMDDLEEGNWRILKREEWAHYLITESEQ